MHLDPRLAALLPIMGELNVLRSYLKQLSDRDMPPGMPSWTDADSAPVDAHGLRPPFWYTIKWIDDSLRRIEPHLHARHWPPIWWRFTNIDAALSLLPRNFHRADADGYSTSPTPIIRGSARATFQSVKIFWLGWIELMICTGARKRQVRRACC